MRFREFLENGIEIRHDISKRAIVVSQFIPSIIKSGFQALADDFCHKSRRLTVLKTVCYTNLTTIAIDFDNCRIREIFKKSYWNGLTTALRATLKSCRALCWPLKMPGPMYLRSKTPWFYWDTHNIFELLWKFRYWQDNTTLASQCTHVLCCHNVALSY